MKPAATTGVRGNRAKSLATRHALEPSYRSEAKGMARKMDASVCGQDAYWPVEASYLPFSSCNVDSRQRDCPKCGDHPPSGARRGQSSYLSNECRSIGKYGCLLLEPHVSIASTADEGVVQDISFEELLENRSHRGLYESVHRVAREHPPCQASIMPSPDARGIHLAAHSCYSKRVLLGSPYRFSI